MSVCSFILLNPLDTSSSVFLTKGLEMWFVKHLKENSIVKAADVVPFAFWNIIQRICSYYSRSLFRARKISQGAV